MISSSCSGGIVASVWEIESAALTPGGKGVPVGKLGSFPGKGRLSGG